MNKWSRTYFVDLGERVASTAIYGLITLLTANSVTDVTAALGWTIVGLPTALSLLKGLLANMSNPDSGPSLVPAPPAPEVNDEGHALIATVCLVVIAAVLLLSWVGAHGHVG